MTMRKGIIFAGGSDSPSVPGDNGDKQITSADL